MNKELLAIEWASEVSTGAEVMEWRTCAHYPEYEISECGDVRRCSGRQSGRRLRGFIDADGYLRYSICDGSGKNGAALAHRLVALTFLGPPPSERHEVAHNNGSRLLNHFSNLRWALRRENHADMQVHQTALKGERNGRAKLSEGDVRIIRREYRRIKNGQSALRIADLASGYGIHKATLCDIAYGRSWRHVPLEEGLSQ